MVSAAPALVAQARGTTQRQATPPGAGVSAAEVRRLASEALHDPGALAELRRVRTVDGRPVDVAGALDTKDPQELDGRLRVLAGDASSTAASPGVDADEARRDAARVLAQGKYHGHEPPRPLRGVLEWVGNVFDTVFGPAGRAVERAFDDVVAPGLQMPLLGAALAVLAGLLAWYFVRRRSRASVERHRRLAGLVGEQADPAELERRADAAEAAGKYGEAVRLRFLAGLVRLDRAGVVEVRNAETTGQLRRALALPAFDALAVAFDEIVYGERPGTACDLAAARAGWSRLLQRPKQPVGAST